MKNNIKTLIIISIFTLFLASCTSNSAPEEIFNHDLYDPAFDNFVYSDTSKTELSFKELVSGATHILDAEYMGIYSSEYQTLFMFKPTRLIKGDVKEDIIYLSLELSSYEDFKYSKGEQYLLYLEKNRSVYKENDIYVRRSDDYISSKSELWGKTQEETINLMSKVENTAPEAYGNEFTTSTLMSDILDVSKNIFEVEIADIFVESTINPTTVYTCKVSTVIQGGASSKVESIYVTLFNDTVKIGEKYVVLLADASESHPVYTLSSRNSVYTLEEALKIPELKELFK